MILGQFVQDGAFVNVFPESENDTSELGSCILVTSKHVVLIKQRCIDIKVLTLVCNIHCSFSMTIEQLFQQMLLKKMHGKAEHLAKLVGADIQELYRVIISYVMD